ncbi:MAG: hypothetical protein NXI24_24530 [bacterium]|nr:hypothetical protein [bacterium]
MRKVRILDRSNFSTLALATILAGILCLPAACTPSRDAETISRLESARDQVHSLYDTFIRTELDEEQIASVDATLAEIHSYEMSKGAPAIN